MQTNEFEQFKDGISGVMGFYGKGVSTFALDVWWSALKSYDLRTVIDAFNRHLANPDVGQFAPKPADIIRMLQGSTQNSALLAWVKVDKAVRQIGTYSDVVFDDALIHRVLQDMGGWIALGTKNESEWPFVAKEFETRYRGFKISGQSFDYPGILIGIANAHNEQKGLERERPVLVGNDLVAMQVMQGGKDKPTIGFKRMSEGVNIATVKQIREVA